MLKKLLILIVTWSAALSSLAQSSDINWESLNQKVGELYGQNRYEEAVVFAEKAVLVAKKEFGENHPNYATSMNNLGLLYGKMGLYIEAEPLYNQAIEIRKVQLGENHPDYAGSLSNLAEMYRNMGLYDESEPLMLKASGICKAIFSIGHPSYAISLNNLALLYENMGRYAEAEPLYEQALAIYKVHFGENHPDYATIQNNLALLYQSMDRYTKAEPLMLKSFEFKKTQLGEGHPDYALYLNNMAALYQNMGRYEEAEPLYTQAMGIYKAELSEYQPSYISSLENLATLYDIMGRYAEAERLMLQSRQVYLHQLRTVFPILSENEKEQFLSNFNDYFEYFHSLALKRRAGNPAITATQYDDTLLLKGLLLQSSSQMWERILAGEDAAAIRLFGDWQALKRKWLQELEILKRLRERIRSTPEATLEKANALEKELSRRSEAFAVMTDTLRTTWREVKRQLQRHEAAIELVKYKWYDKDWTDTVHYAALIATPDTEDHPHLVLLKNGNELEERGAQSYQSAYASRGAGRVEDGEKPIPADSLYSYFWQPIQSALDSLGETGKVYVSPDGVYHMLNLENLRNPKTGKYLLETLDIERVGSTKDIVKKKKHATHNNNAVLVGYPTYSASPQAIATALQRYQLEPTAPVLNASLSSTNYDSFQTYSVMDPNKTSLGPLPGTLAEVELVTSILEGEGIYSQTLLENAASEDFLKTVKSPRILHIATHGFFEPESEKKAEVVDRKMRMSGLERETVSGNPYLRSGLYLAGAETTLQNRDNPYFRRLLEAQEDGILTAYEATLLDLRGTELVVLSACETGLGVTKNGEGVYGLQRAFQVAGAETVIFSLWKVADKQTQEMMGLFYQNWLQKDMTKRQAFKAAQQTIKDKYEDPYYWGAFVMIGG